jgi:hypothetical protein
MRRIFALLIPIFTTILLAACSAVTVESTTGIYYQDDFSNPESGWDRVGGADGVTDYENGMYRLFSALPNYYMWATTGKTFLPDVAVQATVTKRSGPDDNLFGIICRYKDSANYYILMISSDGQAGIAKVVGNEGPFPIEGADVRPAPGINTGNASNLLRAECAGSSLRLLVNGSVVASASDSTFTGGGDAGLWLNTRDMPGVDLAFDDFSVAKP